MIYGVHLPNLTSPCSVNKILPPLMSLCTLKIECKYASPYRKQNCINLQHFRYKTVSRRKITKGKITRRSKMRLSTSTMDHLDKENRKHKSTPMRIEKQKGLMSN